MRLGSIACTYAWPRMIPRSTSGGPNIFLVSTVRQLVCGSSRNLNPMILGTGSLSCSESSSRAAASFEGRCRETGKDQGANEEAGEFPPLDDKPFSPLTKEPRRLIKISLFA